MFNVKGVIQILMMRWKQGVIWNQSIINTIAKLNQCFQDYHKPWITTTSRCISMWSIHHYLLVNSVFYCDKKLCPRKQNNFILNKINRFLDGITAKALNICMLNQINRFFDGMTAKVPNILWCLFCKNIGKILADTMSN